jgi:hypothetical protein
VIRGSELIIGIDFGTTYTGVAHAHSAGATQPSSTAEMQKVADKVFVIKTWPSRTNYYAEKTPSVLSYHKQPPSWGGMVKPTDDPQISYFKLGLQEDIIAHYQTQSHDESHLGGYLSNHNWQHPALPDMKAVDYAGDYLKCINQYVTKEVFPTRFGERFLQNQKLSYVLTVPAIWSDKAKEQTRQAAVAAGIQKEDLTLITEPEAAALYCVTMCDEVDLGPGDRFMICDAGGGTVVCLLLQTINVNFQDLIAYKVVSHHPFRVEECTVGTGAACGAIYLDKGFEALIKRKFEEVGLDQKRLADLLRQFDTSIKRNFNPYDPSAETDFELAISGVRDMPQIGLRDGYLLLPK